MAKKSTSKGGSPAKPAARTANTPEYHRKMAGEHSAKARIHNAQADLMDAKNPPKKGSYRGCVY